MGVRNALIEQRSDGFPVRQKLQLVTAAALLRETLHVILNPESIIHDEEPIRFDKLDQGNFMRASRNRALVAVGAMSFLMLMSACGKETQESAGEAMESAGDAVAEGYETAKDATVEGYEKARKETGEMAEAAGDAASDAYDATREKAGELADATAEKAEEAADATEKAIEDAKD